MYTVRQSFKCRFSIFSASLSIRIAEHSAYVTDHSSMQIAGLGTRGTGTCGTGTVELGHAELGQRFWDMRNWDSGTGTCGTGTAGLGQFL